MDKNNDNTEAKQEAKQAAVRTELKKVLDNTDWLALVDLYANRARNAKMKYDAALVAGFTEAQALDICIKVWA